MTTTYNPDPTTYTVAARVGGSARCPGTQGQVRRTSISPSLLASRIRPQSTGHRFARDGPLLRVDVMAGRWVATRYTQNHLFTHRVVGTDELVHQQIARSE